MHLYIQFESQDIRRYAEKQGYLDVFARAGAELVDPSLASSPGQGAVTRPIR